MSCSEIAPEVSGGLQLGVEGRMLFSFIQPSGSASGNISLTHNQPSAPTLTRVSPSTTAPTHNAPWKRYSRSEPQGNSNEGAGSSLSGWGLKQPSRVSFCPLASLPIKPQLVKVKQYLATRWALC